jgi:hypothetical protein
MRLGYYGSRSWDNATVSGSINDDKSKIPITIANIWKIAKNPEEFI